MSSTSEINARLTRIETLLEQLISANNPAAGLSITNEIAMVKAQGKDLATYFKNKARSKSKRKSA